MQDAKYMKARNNNDMKVFFTPPYWKRMKRFAGLAFLAFLCCAMPHFAKATPLTSLDDLTIYGAYKSTNELWVCSSVAFPVDLAHDAFFANYSTELGTFYEVVPGAPSGDRKPASGVFNVTGRPAGVYEFVFASKIDGFCGMNNGDEAVVRVYLVPELTGFSLLTSLCPKGTATVDLNNYVPFEIANFAKSMGWTIDFYQNPGRKPVKNPLTGKDNQLGKITKADIGVTLYGYTINDSDSKSAFQHKFRDMKDVYRCLDTATIMHNVKVQNAIIVPSDSVSFCLENIRSLHQNDELFSLNLSALLQVGTANGRWEIGKVNPFYVGINATNPFQADININNIVMDGLSFLTLDFYYIYDNCTEQDTALLTVVLTDKIANMLDTDYKKDLCRNLGSGNVDLATFFGFSVPNTAGIWFDLNTPTQDSILPTGTINVDDATLGREYSYKYMVSGAVDNLCYSNSEVANFKLTVRDSKPISGVAVMCQNIYQRGTTINLNNYIKGLDANFIKGVSWVHVKAVGDTTQITEDEAKAFKVGATSIHTLSEGLNTFNFKYTTECGVSPGSLYLNLDGESIVTSQRLVICYTDAEALKLNLYSVLGIVGLEGSDFTLVNPASHPNLVQGTPQQVEDGDANWDGSHIFNANGAFDKPTLDSNGKHQEVFEFTYSKDVKDDCIEQDLKVTIIVTNTVEQ